MDQLCVLRMGHQVVCHNAALWRFEGFADGFEGDMKADSVVPQFFPLRSLHHITLFQSPQNHIWNFGSSPYL